MTIKSLLFLLFLYICLVWVGAAYFYSGPDITHVGLRWTAFGLIAILAYLVGAHLFGWWRRWRVNAAVRPKSAAKPAAVVHEDDAALTALIAEANATLTKSPGYAHERGTAALYGLPWYLLVGPEGSGKTSTFLNSGVEPRLLAGQAAGAAAPGSTRIANLWLAKNAIFAEVSGRVFAGEIGRWTQMLKVLQGTPAVPLWRRLWGVAERRLILRGVIGFCDVREFTGASADPQRFERYCRNWQERLRAIGEVFGVEFPVYQIVTKCDGIPFFAEFFRQLPQQEAGQVLGCTLPFHKIDASHPGEVFAEVEAKRLTKAFRILYHSLAERRLTNLAYETVAARRPAIYEFPRELKRIRSPLVQFLTDAFRPDALRPGPLLRGYYLTAVQEVEASAPEPVTGPDDWKSTDSRSFQAVDATRMFRADTFDNSVNRGGPKKTARRWSFVSELFHGVILADRPVQPALAVDTRLTAYRRAVFAGVCGFCALLCLLFFVSWRGNLNLLHDVQAAADVPQANPATLADFQRLDALRFEVERLRNGASLWLHWGLYSGDRVIDATRAAYFRQFDHLILDDVNREMVNRLRTVPVPPRADDPYDPVYRILKTHLMISAGTCRIEPADVSGTLKEIHNDLSPKTGSESQAMVDRQIEFYSSELAYGDPSPMPQDVAARERARQYLIEVTGVDRLYRRILADAEKTLAKPQRLGDLAPNYTQVMKGPEQVSAAFTKEGWNFVEKASREGNSAVLGETCVLGEARKGAADPRQDAEVAQAIQRLFVRDYIDAWQKYVDGFSIVPFSNRDDAVRKLEILASNRSPLLALLAMTSNQTNFPSEEPTGLQKIGKEIAKAAGVAGEVASKTPAASGSVADISQFFQPVHLVVPPGSEIWGNEKNAAYTEALAHLRSSTQDIIAANSADPALYQAASQNGDKALDAIRQIAQGFKPGGVDAVVQRLLREPILQTKQFTEAPHVTDVVNKNLAKLCMSVRGTFSKYPFRSSSPDDSTLDEFSAAFAPAVGSVWKFAGQLGDVAVKDGSQWKSKDPAQKPQVTPEMLAFLNRAQQIVAAFYPAGATQPRLAYTLRPKLDSSFKDSILELEVDGQPHQWTSLLQKQFIWPAASGVRSGAVARIRTGKVAYPFDSRAGVWGIFRIMGDAEPRALLNPLVEWKYSRVGDGPPDPIDPGPVRMEFPEFPGGIDVFNPLFFAGLQCPVKAVQ